MVRLGLPLTRGLEIFKRRTEPGAAPGTLVINPEAPFPVITVIQYSVDEFTETPVEGPEGLAELAGREGVTWINVDGLGDLATLERIAELFGIHRLALEDVVNVHQRPKVEEYENLLFIVLRIISMENQGLASEQISLFMGNGFIITFQEHKGDCFEPVRQRLRKGKGRIRGVGADYLCYALMDAVVDAYFPILEEMGGLLERLEDEIMETPGKSTVAGIHNAKRDLLVLRRAIWPMREAVNTLFREDTSLVTRDTMIYLRDCYDHVIQVMDMVESYRDIASGLMDFYLSSVSNRMNEVMKVLTIIATIFIPMTFVAGIYGMNFNPEASPLNMPELNWKWGYPAFWAVMAVVATGMVIFFRRRGWLGGGGR